MDTAPGISAVLIALDEADRIEAAIESVSFADEIIVVDGGSADDTPAVARRWGASVIERAFDDFGAQRRFALDQARYDWVLMIDADERVPPALAQEIQRSVVVAGRETAGFLVRRRNYYQGRRIRHAGWSPDWNLRLVRRDGAGVSSVPVHEALLAGGAVERLRSELIHISHRDLNHHLRKIGHYAELWAQEAAAQGQHARWWDLVFRPIHHFLKRYVICRGFQDGVPGLLLCGMGAFHVFYKYARLYEIERRQDRQRRDTEKRGTAP